MAKSKSNGIVSTDNPSLRPTMGTGASALGNVPKPVKGKSVKKSGEAKGGFLEAATATHRANIQERMGATLHPTATLYAANAAAANDVQRNTVNMPSAIGNRDFAKRRQYGQGV